MKNKKLVSTVLLFLLLLGSLTGCGSESRNTVQEAAATYDYGSGGYTMAAKSVSGMNAAPAEEMYMEEDALDYVDDYSYGSSSSSISGPGSEETASPTEEGSEQVNPEKLVYTGNLTVESTDFQSTLSRIKQTISEMGGFIESEDDSDDSYGWYMEGYTKSSSSLRSYIQARIPSPKFYDFLDGIEGENAKVTNRSVYVQNISRQYSETASYIESYEIQERRLLDMMEEATRVSDMLEIESRLSEVQSTLKQYRNSLSGMDTDVAYSTVSISLIEVGIYSRPEATTFLDKIRDSFSEGTQNFVDGVQNFCVWFVGNIFGIILFILIICVIVLIIRKIIRKLSKRPRREKKTVQGRWKRKTPDATDTDPGQRTEEKVNEEADEKTSGN